MSDDGSGEPANVFDGNYFSLPECEDRSEVKKVILKWGGKIKLPAKIGKGGVIHLAPPNFPENELDSVINRAQVVSTDWVFASVKARAMKDTSGFLLYPDAKQPDEAHEQQQVPSSSSGPVPGTEGPKRGHKKGEKLNQWSAAELKILIDYAVEHKDHERPCGNKLWEKACKDNVLPGRTFQSMRECAKRKRSIIYKFIAQSNKEESDPNPKRKRSKDDYYIKFKNLISSSGQSKEACTWALHQCNGNMKRAKDLLFGRIGENEFHPWSEEEDQTIIKFSEGFDNARIIPQEHKLQVIKEFHNLGDDDIQALQVNTLLKSRNFEAIVERMEFLGNYEEP